MRPLMPNRLHMGYDLKPQKSVHAKSRYDRSKQKTKRLELSPEDHMPINSIVFDFNTLNQQIPPFESQL